MDAALYPAYMCHPVPMDRPSSNLPIGARLNLSVTSIRPRQFHLVHALYTHVYKSPENGCNQSFAPVKICN